MQLECLTVWGGGRKTFVIASRLGRSTGVANCFVSTNKYAAPKSGQIQDKSAFVMC